MYWRSEKKQDEDTDVCVAGEGGHYENDLCWSAHVYRGAKGGSLYGIYSVLPQTECGATWSLQEAESMLVGRGLNFCIYPSLECSSIGERPIGELDQQLPPVPVITGSQGRVPLYGSSTARQ